MNAVAKLLAIRVSFPTTFALRNEDLSHFKVLQLTSLTPHVVVYLAAFKNPIQDILHIYHYHCTYNKVEYV